MGINTLTYVPATVDPGDLVRATQRITDADEVRMKPVLREEIVAKRGDESSFGPFWDLQIDRRKGFDGETSDGEPVEGHSGHVSPSVYCRDYSAKVKNSDEGKLIAFGYLIYGGNASAFWCALGEALVKFFGGVVDYNDCDDSYADFQSKATVHAKVTDGDARWTRTQDAITALTTEEFNLSKFDNVPGIYNRFGKYTGETGKGWQPDE